MKRFFSLFFVCISLATVVHADDLLQIPVNFSFIDGAGRWSQKSIIQKNDQYSLRDENGKNRDLSWYPQGRTMLLPLLENIVDLSNSLEIEKQQECSYIITASLDCQIKTTQGRAAQHKKTVKESLTIALGKYCNYGAGLLTQKVTKIDLVEVMDHSQNSRDDVQDVYQIYQSQDEKMTDVEELPIEEVTNFQFKHVSSSFIEKSRAIKNQLEAKIK